MNEPPTNILDEFPSMFPGGLTDNFSVEPLSPSSPAGEQSTRLQAATSTNWERIH